MKYSLSLVKLFFYEKLKCLKFSFYITWIYCLLIPFLAVIQCTNGVNVQGRYSPELANPRGVATLLFFYSENMELTNSQSDFFNAEQLTYRLNVDINLLQESFPSLRIERFDVYQKRELAIYFRVFDIPTLILFDPRGYEVRRWNPKDFEQGGGSEGEIKRAIEKLKKKTR